MGRYALRATCSTNKASIPAHGRPRSVVSLRGRHHLQLQSLRLQLGADLPGRVRGTVDIHVQIAGLEAGVLIIRQF